ncbi:putative nuclease of putative toxin-antitoxin system [Mucilaginibacter sp. UYNi724]
MACLISNPPKLVWPKQNQVEKSELEILNQSAITIETGRLEGALKEEKKRLTKKNRKQFLLLLPACYWLWHL